MACTMENIHLTFRQRVSVSDEDAGEDRSQSGATLLNLLAMCWRGTCEVP